MALTQALPSTYWSGREWSDARAGVLRHRVCYFFDGAVLDTAESVNAIFEIKQSLRKRFGEKRTTVARRMREPDLGKPRVLRDSQMV